MEAGVTLTPSERAAVRRYFIVCLNNLPEFDAYWLPAARWIAARSVIAEKRHALPDDAIHLGTYASPCNPDDFVSDLEDCLAQHENVAPTRTRRKRSEMPIGFDLPSIAGGKA